MPPVKHIGAAGEIIACRKYVLQVIQPSEDDDSDEADEAFQQISFTPAWQPLMEVPDY